MAALVDMSCDNMESMIYANELCNLHGLDTICRRVIAFAIECYENGLIRRKTRMD
jgi:aldehyde:ferredoxin oxidoreductase